VLGLYQCPTIVNNVETLCDVKHIIAMGGGAEYAKLGKPNNTGTRILCVSGDVQKPGYYEIESAPSRWRTHQRYLRRIEAGRQLKAVIPGGSSAKVLRAGEKYKIKDREMTLEDIPWISIRLAARWLHGRLRRRHRHGR
jgi:NADH-quinone oxidoreductase subunit F